MGRKQSRCLCYFFSKRSCVRVCEIENVVLFFVLLPVSTYFLPKGSNKLVVVEEVGATFWACYLFAHYSGVNGG